MLRKLTKTEKFYWLSNQKNPFNMCIAVRFEGSLENHILELALDYVKQSHSYLNVAIESSENPAFITASASKIPICFKEKKYEDEWQREVDKELHNPFDYNSGPLMRVSYLRGLQSNELLLTLDHLIADGVSCLYLVNELFSTIEKIRNGKSISLKTTTPSIISMEELVSEASPPSDSIEEEKFQIDSSLEFGGEVGISSQSGIIFNSLSVDQTQKFLNLCKQNNTTFQGGLFAAGAKALLAKIQKESLETFAEIGLRFHCPVNLRPYFLGNVSPSNLGSFIGILSFDLKLDKSIDFWELARKTREKLSFELNADLPRKTIKCLSNFIDNNISYEELREARRWIGPLIGVSNVGKIDFPHLYGPLEIKSIYPVVALHGMFFNENNIYITALTFRGEMNLGFIYPKSLLTYNKAKELSQIIADNLSV